MANPSSVLILLCLLTISVSALSMNVIDKCWRSDPNWSKNRQALAKCVVGYGKGAIGGEKGKIYVVTSSADDDKNPQPGTLRYGAMLPEPLWITFAGDMDITLKSVIRISAFKTIDGRGAKVSIGNGPGLEVSRTSNVIIHGINFCDTKDPVGDGDAINIITSSNVWVDHCSFSGGPDGLIDVILSSTDITISNNYFTKHNKVILLGNDDKHIIDTKLRATVVFNNFGPECVQRMPRVRQGYAHVANNKYQDWLLYAIGGSSHGTIYSEGNHFIAGKIKDVTHRQTDSLDDQWKSVGDLLENGAIFKVCGTTSHPPVYTPEQAFKVEPAQNVNHLVATAGTLKCNVNAACL